jgi:hypothetical protein
MFLILNEYVLKIYDSPELRLFLQDASTAKTLAFNKDVRTRCITLEGDDFNPGGTLTGGSPFIAPNL